MTFDPATYRHHLDAFDMTDAAKLDCMRVVWAFLEGELDRLSGVSSEQILLGIRASDATRRLPDRLDSTPALTPEFNDAAYGDTAGKNRP